MRSAGEGNDIRAYRAGYKTGSVSPLVRARTRQSARRAMPHQTDPDAGNVDENRRFSCPSSASPVVIRSSSPIPKTTNAIAEIDSENSLGLVKRSLATAPHMR